MKIEFEGVRKVYLLDNGTLILHLFEFELDVTFCGEQIINPHFEPPMVRKIENCVHCIRKITNIIPFGSFLNG